MSISIFKVNLYIKMFYQYYKSYNGSRNAIFWTPKETVLNIINEKKSFIRFGDGEFDIIEGKSIHYQDYAENLAYKLNQIIQEYIEGEEKVNYIVGMPDIFIKSTGRFMIRSRLLLSCWSHTRYYFNKYYDKKVHYGNTGLFSVGLEELYEHIWQDAHVHKIVFVHNNIKYAEEFEQKYQIKTAFVEIPSTNAFKDENKILHKILELVLDQNDTMVLISAGPCGKVLAYDLSKRGIWSIDTGHCWDEPLNDYREMTK